MKAQMFALALSAAVLAGCSGSSALTTGSLFGGKTDPAKEETAPAVKNDPTSRSFQVGSVSARAVKCGFYFDPDKLKASYLASEAQLGAGPDELAKIEKTYTVSYGTVQKVISGQNEYCTERKTKEIKADLSRHLAGDFTPSPPRPKEEDDGGLFTFGGATDDAKAGPFSN